MIVYVGKLHHRFCRLLRGVYRRHDLLWRRARNFRLIGGGLCRFTGGFTLVCRLLWRLLDRLFGLGCLFLVVSFRSLRDRYLLGICWLLRSSCRLAILLLDCITELLALFICQKNFFQSETRITQILLGSKAKRAQRSILLYRVNGRRRNNCTSVCLWIGCGQHTLQQVSR